MTQMEIPKLWRYAPGGVLSPDGYWQVSGRDRSSYFLRRGGGIAIIPCEHFQRDGIAAIEIQISDPLNFIYMNETISVSGSELESIRKVLTSAMNILDRPIVEFAD